MTSNLIVVASNPIKSFNVYVEKCLNLLKSFTTQNSLTQGRILHGHLLKNGVSKDRFIAIKLLILYLDCRRSWEANEIVKEFKGFDIVAHNCLIAANVKYGNLKAACKLFDEMPERNEVSWTAIISGFLKNGRVDESICYFERNPYQNVVSWTAMISGLVQNGYSFEAWRIFLRLLESKVKPNRVTFTSVIKACVELKDFWLGMNILGLIVKSGYESDVSVSNSLITLFLRMGEADLARKVFTQMEKRDVISWTAILDVYMEMGDLRKARRIFDEMPERNEVSWSAMIARYSQSGYPEEALKLFHQMVQDGLKPNISCLSSVLSGLASLVALQAGRSLHAHIVKTGIEEDIFICSALIDLYCKCGETKDGRQVFDSVEGKNVVSWNSMISGYSLNGHMEEAKELFDNMPKQNCVSWSAIIAGYLEYKQFDKVFEVFNEMLLAGEIPNSSTFSSVLCACAGITSLETGKILHGKIIKFGVQYEVFLGTALTDMYAKSGDIGSSREVFNSMPEKNEISWTVMIQGLAESGFAEESLLLFEEMERTSSIAPNELMLLSVLFACSHSGLVDKGLRYFNSMETVYGIMPKGRHYTCMVDMLSRSGRLFEAEEFICSMPFEPESNAWAALLSGCKTYKNEEIAERTAKKLLELAEKNSAGYVLLSNIYASAGRWIDVTNIRKKMKEKGLKKSGGCSWVEVRNLVHSFYSDDGTHSHSVEIYEILELLRSEMVVPR
ncbi:Pentatricopeptide repeat superfamily protein [Tripterygium wilfordii]|uniref:Pentatricopeptide repeat superfamily protein n=1 Tax=Tripterygium wilfordii TaxID=458696 RepID=A0A7J7D2C3_TRIWF|nr:pentatricopeptide repeat-containing protein At5g42450, mitochondrial-like [Tripterygium wilfordii]KAF5740399.1 Pentatricopeptide repeat superfamily protein [Tripterygium wilfordii]